MQNLNVLVLNALKAMYSQYLFSINNRKNKPLYCMILISSFANTHTIKMYVPLEAMLFNAIIGKTM